MLNKIYLFLSHYILIKIPIKIYLLVLILKSSYQEECEKSSPIKKSDNKCYLTYCTNLEFEKEECIISNSIIKTQWLTKITKVGIDTYRFVNLALSSKGDLFLQTTAYPSTNENYFFGLNKKGQPYFTISGESSSIISIPYTDSSIKSRYNGEVINLIINGDESISYKKEYLMSIGKDENNIELFDFEKNEVKIYSTTIDLTTYNIRSKKFSILSINKDNTYSYIFTFIGKGEDNGIYYVLQKYEFSYDSNDNDIKYKRDEYVKISNLESNTFKYILSCFETENQLIICFYYNSNSYYTATLYDSNLLELNSFDFEKPTNNQHLYFKCFHLKKEIGVFYYFLGESEDSGKPILDIIEFIKDSTNLNYERKYLFKSLSTKKDNINNSIYYNSILKLNDNKFGIIQLTESRKEIYIITYNIFNNDKDIIARYYTIDLFNLYNLKISNDIDTILYNKFLVSAFSMYEGEEENGNYFSSLIMFSYPDTKNFEINLLELFRSNKYSFPLNEIIKNKINIDNNIFGLIIKGIKILSYPKNYFNYNVFYLYSNTYSKIIEENDIIDKNDKIDFYYPRSRIYNSQYSIEYASVVTEPDYDIYNTYCDVDSDNGDMNYEKENFEKYDYVGKSGYIIINVEHILTKNCNLSDCLYCLESNKNKCVLDEKKEEKIDIIEDETSDKIGDEKLDEEQLSIIYNKLKSIIEEKSFDGRPVVMDMKDVLLQLSSLEFQEDNLNDQNSTNVFLGKCKDILKEKYNLQDNEVLLMLKLDLFKQNSSHPLVEYEVYNYNNSEKLNLEYCDHVKINVYVPIQLDNKTVYLYNNLNSSGYNLFNSNDSFYTDICSIYTTINGTDMTLTDRLNEYYNQSLSLCQEDGCSYDYYDTKINKIKCECSISQTSKKGESENIQDITNFISTISQIYNNKEKLKQIFSLSVKNMNFKVMKCFELVFKLKYFMKNIGSILLSILIILYLLFMILYLAIGNKMLKELIDDATSIKKPLIAKKNMKFKRNNKKIKTSSKRKKDIQFKKTKTLIVNNINNNINNKIIINGNENGIEIGEKKTNKKLNKDDKFDDKGINIYEGNKSKYFKIKTINFKNHCPPPKYGKNNRFLKGFKNFLIKTKALKANTSVENNINKNDNDLENKDKDKICKEKKNVKIGFKEGEKSIISGNNSEMILNKKDSFNSSKKRKNSNKSKEKIDKNDKDNIDEKIDNSIFKNIPIANDLNDQELNSLSYEHAKILDKRTFIQYYWSLLKKKQLILFTFYPSNDYNIRLIKMTFFIVSFSLYMSINGFFFSDSTMHKVYETNGNFNFIYQIPQILYSTLVSMTINKLLMYLSLSEKSILDLKREKNMKEVSDKSNKIEKCLKIKLLIYFILSFLLMLFFWYFISTFCAVYSNTQIILIKNTLISFGISMIYPFGYALLPGIFRIPSLRAKNKDLEYMYKISELFALI